MQQTSTIRLYPENSEWIKLPRAFGVCISSLTLLILLFIESDPTYSLWPYLFDIECLDIERCCISFYILRWVVVILPEGAALFRPTYSHLCRLPWKRRRKSASPRCRTVTCVVYKSNQYLETEISVSMKMHVESLLWNRLAACTSVICFHWLI